MKKTYNEIMVIKDEKKTGCPAISSLNNLGWSYWMNDLFSYFNDNGNI